MNEPSKHHAKWKKPDVKRQQIISIFNVYLYLISRTETKKIDQWVSGIGGREDWGVTVHVCSVSFWSNANVLELDGSDVCTTLWT